MFAACEILATIMGEGLWGTAVRLILITLCIQETRSVRKYFKAKSEWSHFTSPNFPNVYPNNVDDLYELSSSDYDTVICMKAETFDLQYSENCTRDWVVVQNDLDEHPLGTWCGTNMSTVCSEKGIVFVRFRSDYNVTGSGFKILFRQEVREEGPPVGMIVGITVVPVVIFSFMLCYYLRRRKARLFTDRVTLEAVDNRGSSSQAPTTQNRRNVTSSSQSQSSGVNHLAPPSYDQAVGSKPVELPPSYESLPA